MHLFYTPLINGKLHLLNEEESKHCIKVLRMQLHDEIYLIDGKGGFYTAQIIDPHPKRTALKITEARFEYGKRNHHLHIAIAPTKNIERTEWFLEKAAEIGIDEISIMICDRSERKEVKTERLSKVITAAVKQSLKAYHPKLNEAVSFKKIIESDFPGEKYIAHCIDSDKQFLKQNLIPHSRYLILIGPEGDFTTSEVDLALKAGFKPITLGESRLRTETAALEAVFEINFLNR
ncbi:16S rRNA (uracil(1498)-N(3))-methyltransferase [Daejeonella oryzae]|uniref:16S rRNA (uracil(1498)-N(3))-methyltransferase n=1 Tax=Daejeonella oryzae TaxID=1122943 RepID=UPI000421236A|nr:16S rRNA (uracil(1498)-N(3))-methyltransferase [Daejeonella oryzae]